MAMCLVHEGGRPPKILSPSVFAYLNGHCWHREDSIRMMVGQVCHRLVILFHQVLSSTQSEVNVNGYIYMNVATQNLLSV